MSTKLYVGSEDLAMIGNNWAKNLSEDLFDNAYKAGRALFDCSEFCIANVDAMEDERENPFSADDFEASRQMEELKREVEDAISLRAKLNGKISRIYQMMENIEFVYSEEFEKWYDEKHRYDYERA